MFNSYKIVLGFAPTRRRMYDVAYALENRKRSRSGSSQFFRDWMWRLWT